MPFSRGAIFGQQLGSGLSQGLLNQFGFQNTLNRANTLYDLGQQTNGGKDRLSLALALMGGQSGGNDLNAVLSQILLQYAKQNGLLGATPDNQVNQLAEASQIRENSNPQSGVASKIRSYESEIEKFKSQLQQGEILVKDRNGNYIALPQNEFDQNLYERVE